MKYLSNILIAMVLLFLGYEILKNSGTSTLTSVDTSLQNVPINQQNSGFSNLLSWLTSWSPTVATSGGGNQMSPNSSIETAILSTLPNSFIQGPYSYNMF